MIKKYRGKEKAMCADKAGKFSETINLIKNYLEAIEQNDIILANFYLSDDPEFIFPGNKRFSSLGEMSEWAGYRYLRIRKSHDVFDIAVGDEELIVYVIGHLNGEWLSGTRFSNIRFIDRFKVKRRKIVQHMVWNDIGEFKDD